MTCVAVVHNRVGVDQHSAPQFYQITLALPLLHVDSLIELIVRGASHRCLTLDGGRGALHSSIDANNGKCSTSRSRHGTLDFISVQ